MSLPVTEYVRKALVVQAGGQSAVAARLVGKGTLADPLQRQVVGGARSGFQATPMPGDYVAIVSEYQNRPLAVLGCSDPAIVLPTQQAGESAIYAPDGRILCYAKSDGTTTLFQDHTGRVVISIDAASNVGLDAGAGTISLKSPLVLTNQATGSGTLTGTVSGSTCSIPITKTLNLSVNGSTYQLVSL